jgi:hypothetical protein
LVNLIVFYVINFVAANVWLRWLWLRVPNLAAKFPFPDIVQPEQKVALCAANKISHLLLLVRDAPTKQIGDWLILHHAPPKRYESTMYIDLEGVNLCREGSFSILFLLIDTAIRVSTRDSWLTEPKFALALIVILYSGRPNRY